MLGTQRNVRSGRRAWCGRFLACARLVSAALLGVVVLSVPVLAQDSGRPDKRDQETFDRRRPAESSDLVKENLERVAASAVQIRAVLIKDPGLSGFAGRVSDSGEGRWTIKAAIDEGLPAHVLSSALYERFSSRGEADFADKLLSAMRYEFGGHLEKPAES